MSAPFRIGYKRHQTARNNFWSWKNLEIFKTQNWSKLKSFTSWDQEFVQLPPFFERKAWGIRGYNTLLGWPRIYSWTHRSLWHQNRSVAINTYMLQNWDFLIYCHLKLNFKFSVLWCCKWSLMVKYPTSEACRVTKWSSVLMSTKASFAVIWYLLCKQWFNSGLKFDYSTTLTLFLNFTRS